LPLYLHGVGHFHPETRLDNAFFEQLDIGTSDAWILERVGIRERRTVLPLDYIKQTRNRDLRAADEAATLSTVESSQRRTSAGSSRAAARVTARPLRRAVASPSAWARTRRRSTSPRPA
jgi:3-oxoacyl-[acyl-carrier-protein] synthase-3